MKKKRIVGVICALVLITAIFIIVEAKASYDYDMENHSDDKWIGFGAVIITMIGGFFIFYELDLFYTVYYFICKPKTVIKSVLNILCNLSLVLVFAFLCFSDIFMEIQSYETIPLILLLTYIVLRVVYALVSLFHKCSLLKDDGNN